VELEYVLKFKLVTNKLSCHKQSGILIVHC